MLILKYLLSPFALLYQLITGIRNYLYAIGHFKSFSFQVPMVSVGNLTVGGTGKTPHIEYLIKLFSKTHEVAVLSRGYGRKTKGFILADVAASAKTIGDEPMQYFKKFGKLITVAVGENRAYAVPCIVFEKPTTEVILLDDAYQHRKVKPQCNILLSDYNRPFYTDFVLPMGLLRESRAGANRADMVVVSKCPAQLSKEEMRSITSKINIYAPNKKVFFTGIQYGEPIAFNEINKDTAICDQVILFAGLANITPLKDYISKKYNLLQTFDFKDHHQYTTSDLELLKTTFNSFTEKNKCLLTTEKDMVKLLDPALKELLSTYPVFYMPIEVYFLENEDAFKTLLLDKTVVE